MLAAGIQAATEQGLLFEEARLLRVRSELAERRGAPGDEESAAADLAASQGLMTRLGAAA